MLERAGHRRDERGATLVMVVLMMSVVVAVASLVIDVGRDRIVRRDMQAVADLVALDMVRQLSGGTSYAGYSGGWSSSLWSTQKGNSLARQGGLIVSPTEIELRLEVADEYGNSVPWPDPADTSKQPNAVSARVAGNSTTRFSTATSARGACADTTPGAGCIARRKALAAMDEATACIAVGGALVSATPGGTLTKLLDGIIGVNELTLVSSAGLASLAADINLLELASELNFGSVDELADATVSRNGFVIAAANVLSRNGDSSAATILTSVASHLSGSFLVGSILNVDTGNGTGASMTVDAGSLLQSTIMQLSVANGSNLVNLNVNSPSNGLTSFAIQATVISPPVIACGPAGTQATSAQVKVKLKSTIGGSGLVSLVGSASLDDPDGLSVTSAQATGSVTGIVCSTNTMTVSASSQLATAELDELKVRILSLLGITVANLTVKANGTVGSASAGTFSFTHPGDWGAKSAGSTSLALLPQLSLSGVLTFGGTVASLIADNDGLAAADNAVLGVLTGLGVEIGKVTVRPVGELSCNTPVLRN